MHVILDTNVLVSRLLVRSSANASVVQIITAAILGKYTLLMPEEVFDELRRLRTTKEYLRNRISERDVEDLVRVLGSIAVMLPRQTKPIPSVLRDPKDDFLLIAAAIGDADYLVTGDRDLLDIREHLTRPRIVAVAEFLEILSP